MDRPEKSDKRAQILDAALGVFGRKGVFATRIADIASEAGIAYGLVYHYFKNKEEVLNTIFEDQWAGVTEGLELAEKEEHAVWLEIVRFTDHMARSLIRDAGMTRALEWDFDHSYPRVAARVAKLMMQEFEAHSVAEDDDDWIGPSAH